MNLYSRVVKKYNELVAEEKVPDCIFMSKHSIDVLAAQSGTTVKPNGEFLGMKVYPAEQYIEEKFRIYCKYIAEEEKKVA